MAKIVLKNPYFEEEIKVKESFKRIADMLGWLEREIYIIFLYNRLSLLKLSSR